MNRFWPLHSMKVSMNYLLVYRGFDDPREYVLSFQLYCFPSALKMVQDIERELNQSALRPSINILQQNGDSPWPSHLFLLCITQVACTGGTWVWPMGFSFLLRTDQQPEAWQSRKESLSTETQPTSSHETDHRCDSGIMIQFFQFYFCLVFFTAPSSSVIQKNVTQNSTEWWHKVYADLSHYFCASPYSLNWGFESTLTEFCDLCYQLTTNWYHLCNAFSFALVILCQLEVRIYSCCLLLLNNLFLC